MSSIEEDNIRSLPVPGYANWPDTPTRFCFAQMVGFSSDDEGVRQKQTELLTDPDFSSRGDIPLEHCTIGGCTYERTTTRTAGAPSWAVKGMCKAASYCLQEESAKADAEPDHYDTIMDTCHGILDSMNAGRLCPRLDCGFSTGVSIDGVAGNDGVCVRDQTQMPLPISELE